MVVSARSRVSVDSEEGPRHKGTESLMMTAGITRWELRPDIPISEVDIQRGRKNQARLGTPLEREVVRQYAQSIGDGAEMPPVVLAYIDGSGSTAAAKRTKLYYNADGNHRTAGYIDQGILTLPWAYVIAPETRGTYIEHFMQIANTVHGLRNSEEDRLAHAIQRMRDGMSAETAASTFQLSRSKLLGISRLLSTEQRALRAGVDMAQYAKLGVGVQTRIGALSTDEGLRALVPFAVKSRLSARDMSTIITSLNDTRDGAEQAARIKALYDSYADAIEAAAIQGRNSSGKSRSNPLVRASQIMGQAATQPLSYDWVANIPPSRYQALERQRNAVQKWLNGLTEALGEYAEKNADRL